MKQKPQVAPVEEVAAQPAPVTRLTQEQLAELLVVARKNYANWQNFGGDSTGATLSLLLFDFLHAMQEQNRLLVRIADALQPGQEIKKG